MSPEAGSSVVLTDDDGERRSWRSDLEALNDLALEGWELVAAFSQSEAENPERIYGRLILSRERKLEPRGVSVVEAVWG